MNESATKPESKRIDSLDQFRGYTVLGMFFVNYLGSYAAIHWIFKHHNNFCSYADTIMPHFFFCVGYAYRLTLMKRIQSGGLGPAYWKTFKRALGLGLVGFVLYQLEGGFGSFRRIEELGYWGIPTNWEQLKGHGVVEWFYMCFKNSRYIQTLVHIAITTIWVMPVMGYGVLPRFAWMLMSAGLHVWLSYYFYFDWIQQGRGIDGGPLGFMTWTVPVIFGSFTYDLMAGGRRWNPAFAFLLGGSILMGLGYGFSCLDTMTAEAQEEATKQIEEKKEEIEKPRNKQGDDWYYKAGCPFIKPERGFRPNMWTMNQRAGTISYLTFATGLSLYLYAFFVIVCDIFSFGSREGPSILGLFMVICAWPMLILGSLGFIGSFIAFVRLPLESAPLPGGNDFIVRANEWLLALDRDGWTWMLLATWGIAWAGWELRRWAHGQGTCIGSVLRTLGGNALAGYIIHMMVDRPIKKYTPMNSPLWYVLCSFLVYFAVIYIIMRYMEKNKMFLRL